MAGKGFFIPSTYSQSFLTSKKSKAGDYQYDTETGEVGLQYRSAIQSINKQYSSTIDTAYSDYLSASRAVAGSEMGGGYKEAYLEKQRQGLISSLAESNFNAANFRAEFAQQAAQGLGSIGERFKAEQTMLNKTAMSIGGYVEYLKGLSKMVEERDKKGEVTSVRQDFLTDEQKNIENLEGYYDMVLGDPLNTTQPRDYLDESGDKGLSYVEWVNANLKDNEIEQSWADWLFAQGGLDMFREMTKRKK